MDEDTIAARDNGYRLYSNLISAATESLSWGAYLVLFIFALTIQCRRGPRSPTSVLMLFVTIIMFCSSTVLWALNISWSLLRIRTTLITSWDKTWQERIAYNSQVELSPLGAPMEALFMMNMLLGDAVVVTRAKVVWGGSWKIVAVPVFLLVAALTFSITGIVCLGLDGFGSTTGNPTAESYVCRRAEPIAWALSIITNVIATGLIAYKAWQHRQLTRWTIGGRSRVQRILSLMVESGFVYILLLISQLIVFWEGVEAGKPSLVAFAVLAPLGDQITGIYATSVIVLVALHRTYWDGTTTSPPDFLPEIEISDLSNTRINHDNNNLKNDSLPQQRRKYGGFGRQHHNMHGVPNFSAIQFAPPTSSTMRSLDPSPGLQNNAMSVELKRFSESGTSGVNTHPYILDDTELGKDGRFGESTRRFDSD